MLKNTKNLLISISGVRGKIPEGLSAENILKFSLSFGTYIRTQIDKNPAKKEQAHQTEQKKPKIILGRDNRPTGKMLDSLVKGALISQGFRVIDLGVAPTPSVKSVVIQKKASAGIMLSASHNPEEWNAFKFISENGLFFNNNQIYDMMKIFESGKFDKRPFSEMGSVVKSLAYKNHIQEIIESSQFTKIIKKRHFKVAVDPGGCAAYKALPEILKRFNCKIYKINSGLSQRFPRPPEPVPSSLGQLCELTKKYKCDIGFATDPDADRLAVVDENGHPIGEEYTLPLAMLSALQKRKGDIVVNLSSSLLNEFIAKKFNKKVIRSKIGESNVVEKMLKNNAAFGGEGNGGVIDPKISSFGRDSLSGIMHILGTMASLNKTVSQIVAEFPSYKMNKLKVSLEQFKNPPDFDEIKKYFAEKLGPGYKLDERDGIHMHWGDYWLHIRKSNTEPILRFIYECEDPKIDENIRNSIKEKFDI